MWDTKIFSSLSRLRIGWVIPTRCCEHCWLLLNSGNCLLRNLQFHPAVDSAASRRWPPGPWFSWPQCKSATVWRPPNIIKVNIRALQILNLRSLGLWIFSTDVRVLCSTFDLLLCCNWGVDCRDLLETPSALAGHLVCGIARRANS